MEAPAYFLMARIPIVAGSSGYHRAALIQSAFKHIDEWWLGGTDYTRHWLPTGIKWSPDHTDITNHYLHMGVVGGLPLMIIFIIVLIAAFSYVGQSLKVKYDVPSSTMFMIWAWGASLFAHAVTMLSVSYYDQSFVFLYITIAAIGSIWAETINPQISNIPTGTSQSPANLHSD